MERTSEQTSWVSYDIFLSHCKLVSCNTSPSWFQSLFISIHNVMKCVLAEKTMRRSFAAKDLENLSSSLSLTSKSSSLAMLLESNAIAQLLKFPQNLCIQVLQSHQLWLAAVVCLPLPPPPTCQFHENPFKLHAHLVVSLVALLGRSVGW